MRHLLSALFCAALVFRCGAEEIATKSAAPIQDCAVKEEAVTTQHAIVLNGETFNYKATAGTLILKDDKCDPKGSFFYVSYVKEGVEDPSQRPVAFCFNGGPGSSSVWLHLGLLGPKRIDINDKSSIVSPIHLVDNAYSLLDLTDLVFIDPISTGYSRAIPADKAKEFHGYTEDIKSVAEFIRIYLANNGRWNSPKFVVGESYGTTRAAGLAAHLHDESYIYLNGLIFISTHLDYQCVSFDKGNDLPYLLFLPSYTACAWAHNKLESDLQADFSKAISISRQYASKAYGSALFQGEALSSQDKKRVSIELARLTGLSPEYIEKSNLRVRDQRFMKELLSDRELLIGRFDGRLTGADDDKVAGYPAYDPSLERYVGPFTVAMNDYLQKELNYKRESEYKVLTNVFPWDYGKDNCYLNNTSDLGSTMLKNPDLRIFVASGYYDLATPFFEAEYSLNHLSFTPSVNDRVTLKYYNGGHMMYFDMPALKQLRGDLALFIQGTLNAQSAK